MLRKIFIPLLLLFSLHTLAQKKADSISRKMVDTADFKKVDSSGKIATDSNAVKKNTVAPLKNPKIVYGIASFYSRSLDGTKTATGETFRQTGMTAASNFFKLNTWVRVTNLRSGKSIIVRINDRMHPSMAKKGRVVDLSRKGATILDFIVKGLIKVKVEEVPNGTLE